MSTRPVLTITLDSITPNQDRDTIRPLMLPTRPATQESRIQPMEEMEERMGAKITAIPSSISQARAQLGVDMLKKNELVLFPIPFRTILHGIRAHVPLHATQWEVPVETDMTKDHHGRMEMVETEEEEHLIPMEEEMDLPDTEEEVEDHQEEEEEDHQEEVEETEEEETRFHKGYHSRQSRSSRTTSAMVRLRIWQHSQCGLTTQWQPCDLKG